MNTIATPLANSTHIQLGQALLAPKAPLFQAIGAMRGDYGQSLAVHQHVQSFQVPGQAHQAPLTGGGVQTTQRELAETQNFLDDADTNWIF